MFSAKSFIRYCVASSILLLPIAHLKLIIFGIPLYSVEAPILLAFVAYAYGWKQGTFSPLAAVDFRNPFVIGITLFFSGAILSFFANPLSLSGLGMLKTWFIFPLLALWLWLETDPDSRDLDHMLLACFGMSVLVAAASLPFLFRDALTYDGRLAAWQASPNSLAFLLAPGVLLAGYFLSSSVKRNRSRLFVWPSVVLLVTALFFTRSYETWASVSAALALFLVLGRPAALSWRRRITPVIFLIGILSLFIFFESGSEKWQSLTSLEARSSLASRVMIWESAARIISDQPFFGIGIGRFQETYLAYQRYFPPYLEWAVPQPHNLYLAVWLETGLLGLCGFGLLMAAWIRGIAMVLRSETSCDAKRTASLLLSLSGFFLVLGIFDTPFFKTDIAFVFWFVLAFGVGFLNAQKKRPETA